MLLSRSILKSNAVPFPSQIYCQDRCSLGTWELAGFDPPTPRQAGRLYVVQVFFRNDIDRDGRWSIKETKRF
jgi:hypothetical protein